MNRLFASRTQETAISPDKAFTMIEKLSHALSVFAFLLIAGISMMSMFGCLLWDQALQREDLLSSRIFHLRSSRRL
jgi:hypothetical protein